LDTDASNHNVGTVLSHVQNSCEVVLAYSTKALSTPEKNYCTTRREVLAIDKTAKHLKPYL